MAWLKKPCSPSRIAEQNFLVYLGHQWNTMQLQNQRKLFFVKMYKRPRTKHEDVLEDSDSEPGLFSSNHVNHLTITPNLFTSDSNINIIVNDWIESIDINEHKLNWKIDTDAHFTI